MAVHGCTWLYMAVHGCTWLYMAVRRNSKLTCPNCEHEMRLDNPAPNLELIHSKTSEEACNQKFIKLGARVLSDFRIYKRWKILIF